MQTVQNLCGTVSIGSRPSSASSGSREEEFGRYLEQTYSPPDARRQNNGPRPDGMEDANKANTKFGDEGEANDPVGNLEISQPADSPTRPEHALFKGFAIAPATTQANAEANSEVDEQAARSENPVQSTLISGHQLPTVTDRTGSDPVQDANNQSALRLNSGFDPKGKAALSERQEASSFGLAKFVNGSGIARQKDNPKALKPNRRPEITSAPFDSNSGPRIKGATLLSSTETASATKIAPGKPEVLAVYPGTMHTPQPTNSDRKMSARRGDPLPDASSTAVSNHRAEAGTTMPRNIPLAPVTLPSDPDQEQVFAVSEPKSQDQVFSLWQEAEIQTGSARAADILPIRPEALRIIATQISDALIKTQNNKVEIALSPEELGRVRLALSMTETGISVLITAERSETLDLMRRHIDQLAEELRSLGYQDIGFEFTGRDTQQGFEYGPAQGDPKHLPEPENSRDTSDPIEIARASLSRGLDLRL